MRRVLLTLLGAAVVVVLLSAGTVLFSQPRAWVLWVGGAHPDDPFVNWISALQAYRWRFDCEAARPHEERDGGVEKLLRPLDAYFRGWRAVDLDEAALTRYVATRQASTTRRGGPPANGTINRELSLLGTLLRLAARRRKVLHPPTITLLKEAAPRAGFFEPQQFATVRRHLRPDLQLAVDRAYTYGWRVRDEVLPLARRHVDLAAGTIRLAPGESKNEDGGRLIYLTPEIAAALQAQLARVDALARRLGRIVPWLFVHETDGPLNLKTGTRRYVAGDRVKDFRRA